MKAPIRVTVGKVYPETVPFKLVNDILVDGPQEPPAYVLPRLSEFITCKAAVVYVATLVIFEAKLYVKLQLVDEVGKLYVTDVTGLVVAPTTFDVKSIQKFPTYALHELYLILLELETVK